MKLSIIFSIILVLSSCVYNTLELPEPLPVSVTQNGGKTIINAIAPMSFSPSSVIISLGDTVEFRNSSGFHNVNGTQITYPSNPESFGNAIASSWTYVYVFNTIGNYSYQCDVHGVAMSGTITVQ